MNKEVLERKIANATSVLDNIKTPGWIDTFAPRATNLRAVTYDNPVIQRLTDKLREKRIDSIIIGIEAALPKYREQAAKEELIGRSEIFTQQQATVVASTIWTKKDAIFIGSDNNELFTFTLDPDVIPIIHNLMNLPVDFSRRDLTDQERLSARRKTLKDVDLLLKNPNLLAQAVNEGKLGNNMLELLVWLSEQNDMLGGRLCDLLSLENSPIQTGVIRRRENYAVGQRIFVRVPPEIATDIKRILTQNLDNNGSGKPEANIDNIIISPNEANLIGSLVLDFIRSSPSEQSASILVPLAEALAAGYSYDDTLDIKTRFIEKRDSVLAVLRIIASGDEASVQKFIDGQSNVRAKSILTALTFGMTRWEEKFKLLTSIMTGLLSMSESLAWRRWGERDIRLVTPLSPNVATAEEIAQEAPPVTSKQKVNSAPSPAIKTVQTTPKDKASWEENMRGILESFTIRVLEAPDLPSPATKRQITRAFNSMVNTLIDKLDNEGYVHRATGVGTRNPTYDHENIALMLLVQYYLRRGGINSTRLSAAQEAVVKIKEYLIKRQEDKT